MTELELLEVAKKVKEKAYAPYSKFQVGAALLTKSGNVFDGCNIENVSYGATTCAERVAMQHAIVHGEREFDMIAIASSGKGTVYPCGICRQVMQEFSKDMKVICESDDGYEVYALAELLPKGFE